MRPVGSIRCSTNRGKKTASTPADTPYARCLYKQAAPKHSCCLLAVPACSTPTVLLRSPCWLCLQQTTTSSSSSSGSLVRSRVVKNSKGGLFRIRHLQDSDLLPVAQLQVRGDGTILHAQHACAEAALECKLDIPPCAHLTTPPSCPRTTGNLLP